MTIVVATALVVLLLLVDNGCESCVVEFSTVSFDVVVATGTGVVDVVVEADISEVVDGMSRYAFHTVANAP